ncbi:MAG: flagellar hook-associated protein FlgL [Amphritea sp.]|nr:flagellar hook-associated protein FlgL [Amphritea sp.]
MRISTQQQYLNSIDNMQQSQNRLATLQNQISSGKKLVNPSDDPVAAAQVVKLDRELAQYKKFDDNINVTKRRLGLEETILKDINTTMDRMKELALQGGNASLSDSDRKAVASELRQLTEYVAGLMNTQDSEGEYLFAGSKGTTQPYEVQADGSYLYQGDDGQRLIQVGPETLVPSNDSGLRLFQAIDTKLEVNLTGQAVSDAKAANTDPFMSNISFADDDAEAEFQRSTKGLGSMTLTVNEVLPAVVPAQYQYSIVDSAGNPVKDAGGANITNVAAGDLSTPLAVNLHGMEFELQAPADLLNANSMTFRAEKQATNILDAALKLAAALEKPVKGDVSHIDDAVKEALVEFRQASDRNVETRAVLGGRLKSLDFISSSNQDFKLLTESAKSTLVDTDMAEAISKLTLEQTTLQAAQSTFSRVASLSLFDYLR